MEVSQLMQRDVAVVSPELTLHQLEQFLTAEEISGAPVVGAEGKVLGVVSKTDIVAALADRVEDALGLRDETTVGDIMSSEVVIVSPDAEIEDVVRVMLDGHLHRVVVADAESIVGIVTPFDLLTLLLDRD